MVIPLESYYENGKIKDKYNEEGKLVESILSKWSD